MKKPVAIISIIVVVAVVVGIVFYIRKKKKQNESPVRQLEIPVPRVENTAVILPDVIAEEKDTPDKVTKTFAKDTVAHSAVSMDAELQIAQEF